MDASPRGGAAPQGRARRHPVGPPTLACFTIEDSAVAALRNGEVLRRTIYLSLDPYMRGWMDDRPLSYAPSIVPVGLGEVMVGGTVSEVLESNDATFSP